MAATYGKKEISIMQSVDRFTIILYLVLMAMGWISVCGASYSPDLHTGFFDLGTRSGMQIVWIGTSLVLGSVILSIDERLYDTFAYVLYGAFMLLLLITPFLAHDIKGSMSWIKIGSFSVQPAEFAKFSTALCLAKYISHYGFSMSKWKDFITTYLIILVPMALIVLQRETGSALVYTAFFLMLYREGMPGSIIFSGIAAVIYFVVGVRYADDPFLGIKAISLGRFLVLLCIMLFSLGMMYVYTSKTKPILYALQYGFLTLLIGALTCLYIFPFDLNWIMLGLCVVLILYLFYLALKQHRTNYALIALFALGSMAFHYSSSFVLDKVMEPHQQTRIRVLLGMEDDPRGAGYNVIQAKIAIGSGGLQGKGFLNGTQTKLKYVPEQDTDFIFCTVGEEEGFLGCAVVLCCFLALIIRLVVLAERQPTTMTRVYGYCVLSVFMFHLFINVGMVLGLTPVIGIPLPFFSYGGSSLWGFTLLLFIFLRMDAGRLRLQH